MTRWHVIIDLSNHHGKLRRIDNEDDPEKCCSALLLAFHAHPVSPFQDGIRVVHVNDGTADRTDAVLRLAAELECHNSSHQRFSARSGVLRPARREILPVFVRIAGEGRVLCKGAPGFTHHGTAPALRSCIFSTIDYHAANIENRSADRSHFGGSLEVSPI